MVLAGRRGERRQLRDFHRPATVPLLIVSFFLTPQDRQAQTPRNFPVGIRSRGRKGKDVATLLRGETACSICRAGLCNASIRSVRLAVTGCVRLTPLESCAAIAAPRSEMFRRHSAPACGCVPARWVVTVHRVARQDGSANRASDSQGRSSRPRRDEPSPPIFLSRRPISIKSLIIGILHLGKSLPPVIPRAGFAREICFFFRIAQSRSLTLFGMTTREVSAVSKHAHSSVYEE